ncbi:MULTISPECIES: winged helix-turn-helix domain-containing protein [unclassified Rhizobium]|uniref:winged helix-turn-helix domain-containing protein n=1 Tax=unclassified Rhizobium TaxID=2613769 RepID=UPI00177ED83D|nr:response regulator transcription factor [Rhizobium sp. CFBP 13644]MBD8691822.1 response regulator transcription factor [Rhizobium sp. CFBP 13717]
MNILVIEDDPRVADFLERGLRAEGYSVTVARDGPAGIEKAHDLWHEWRSTGSNGAILLDVMLPIINGSDVCQTLRASGISAPILMLTALGSVNDRISGLRMGADDYLVKPFSFEELLARIEALMRRPVDMRPLETKILCVGPLELDRESMRVTVEGSEISMTAKELALLELFMSTPGRVLSRERILANIWGAGEDPLTNVVDVYVRRLRAKIDRPSDSSSCITTVRGIGYRLEQGR